MELPAPERLVGQERDHQPFWGRQLHSIGLAAAPIPQKKLTVDRLTAAIGDALGCRPAAGRVGLEVRKEHGLQTALSVLASC